MKDLTKPYSLSTGLLILRVTMNSAHNQNLSKCKVIFKKKGNNLRTQMLFSCAHQRFSFSSASQILFTLKTWIRCTFGSLFAYTELVGSKNSLWVGKTCLQICHSKSLHNFSTKPLQPPIHSSSDQWSSMKYCTIEQCKFLLGASLWKLSCYLYIFNFFIFFMGGK